MFPRLGWLVLLLCAPFTTHAQIAPTADWEQIASTLARSVVPITYRGDGGCSGFVIDAVKHHVLTASHCDADLVYVDMIPAVTVAKDSKQDLLVLMVKDLDRPAVTLAKHDPSIGQQVASLGYGYAWQRPMFRVAHVSDDKARIPELSGGPYILIDAPFVGGQSGGPVINAAGEVVMIVQLASPSVGVGIGAEMIRDRVGRYLGKGQP